MCGEDRRCEPVAFCPPQTCDCPTELDPILRFGPDMSEAEALDDDELRLRFRCLALLGTDGDTYEKGLEAVERALTPPLVDRPPNKGFLREDAYLVIIFLSDENDCSDRGELCQEKSDCPDPDNYACRQDPVERDRKYCRLPQRETQECEYWGDRLVDVREVAATLKDLKASDAEATGEPCSSQDHCSREEGLYCSRRFERCAHDSGKVIVAGIVGERELFCTTECPSPDGRDCEPSSACEDPCSEGGTFCAERTYRQGVRSISPTCIDPTFGSAYTGRRYHELIAQFGDQGIIQSICGGQIDVALQRIADLVTNVIPDSFCLARPLPSCSGDDDCHGDATCLRDPALLGRSAPFCSVNVRLVDGSSDIHPTDLIIEIQPDDGRAARVLAHSDWRFFPVEHGGCVEFLANGPGAQETLFLRYVTPLDPDMPLRRP